VKLAHLRRQLTQLAPLAIAFSGGVDSTLLLRLALDTLGADKVLAITADSPLTARGELLRARELAQAMGAQHLVLPTLEFADQRVRSNPPDRCYFCKRIRFEALRQAATASGFVNVADGTNADDAADYRPGTRAAAELGIVSPLRDAGLTKAEIRELSRRYALPTADLPSFACLASRVPYGTGLEEAQLQRIEAGEKVLAALGVQQYRLRDHGDVARLEVLPQDFATVIAAREVLVAALRELGYTYVALDLTGYRTGSMNQGIA